jgi:hypothetical protein
MPPANPVARPWHKAHASVPRTESVNQGLAEQFDELPEIDAVGLRRLHRRCLPRVDAGKDGLGGRRFQGGGVIDGGAGAVAGASRPRDGGDKRAGNQCSEKA